MITNEQLDAWMLESSYAYYGDNIFALQEVAGETVPKLIAEARRLQKALDFLARDVIGTVDAARTGQLAIEQALSYMRDKAVVHI